jgi:hypothetical protein
MHKPTAESHLSTPSIDPEIVLQAELKRQDRHFNKTIPVPSAEYIRRNIPIKEVAQRLGLEPEPKGQRCVCPLDHNHLARIWLKKNWVLCHKCRKDGKGRHWNPIDLVMEVTRMNFKDTLSWFARYWRVPLCDMRLSTNERGTTTHSYAAYKPRPLPKTLTPSLELIKRSPWWSKLSRSTRQLVPYILKIIPGGDSPSVETTQERLRDLAGINHRATMAKAMQELRNIGLISTQRVAAPRQPLTRYTTHMLLRLEWASRTFQDWLTGKIEYWFSFVRLTSIWTSLLGFTDIATKYRCSVLNVQNPVFIHENEHPNNDRNDEHNPPAMSYLDKGFTSNLFAALDAGDWLKTPPQIEAAAIDITGLQEIVVEPTVAATSPVLEPAEAKSVEPARIAVPDELPKETSS